MVTMHDYLQAQYCKRELSAIELVAFHFQDCTGRRGLPRRERDQMRRYGYIEVRGGTWWLTQRGKEVLADCVRAWEAVPRSTIIQWTR
jgi:hypothetical protein